jgi:signal transduction histidine kinase
VHGLILGLSLLTEVTRPLSITGEHAAMDAGIDFLFLVAVLWAVMWTTRRLREDARLRELEQQQERDLVGDASHELRTLITVVRGHAELIHDAGAGALVAEDAEVILSELDRMALISDRLLLLAAAGHPQFVHRVPVEVERVVVSTVRRWSVLADRRWRMNVTVEGVVLADEERLLAVLDALLENAVKYTVDGDSITVSAWSDRDAAMIEVADAGAGISRERIGRIFDRFERGGKRGTGLGLAVVKAIVEAHDGTVTIDSELGEGARFRVRLPGLQPVHAERRELVRALTSRPGNESEAA